MGDGPPPVPPRDLSLGQSMGTMGTMGSIAMSTAPRSISGDSWDGNTEMMARELEEVKLRAAQMEKTMRWWSDCTANWRDKWSKVRNERNKAREEARTLRSKLEIAVKELSSRKWEHAEELRQGLVPAERSRNSVASSKSDTDGNEDCPPGDTPTTQQDCDTLDQKGHDKRKSGRRKGEDSTVLAQQVAALQKQLEEASKKAQHEHE